ncbi:MAG TPA: hypothetical protein VJ739_04690 [Gemmataceae bacterium]|nr:hypothetical protein [Gemmataceae bacterium]
MPRQLPAAEELRGANFLSARIPQWLRDLFHRHRSASRLADGSPMPAYAFAELIWRESGPPPAQPLIPAQGVNATPAAISFRLTTETYNRLRADIRASQVPKDQFIARELAARLRTIRLDLVQRPETPEEGAVPPLTGEATNPPPHEQQGADAPEVAHEVNPPASTGAPPRPLRVTVEIPPELLSDTAFAALSALLRRPVADYPTQHARDASPALNGARFR